MLPAAALQATPVSSQSQGEVTDHLSIHQTPAAEKRPLGPYKEIPSLRIAKRTDIRSHNKHISEPQKTRGSLENSIRGLEKIKTTQPTVRLCTSYV